MMSGKKFTLAFLRTQPTRLVEERIPLDVKFRKKWERLKNEC